MSRLPIMGACLALTVAGVVAWGAAAQTTRESTVQFALENVVSGTPVPARVGTMDIVVKPIRTWKSVSGHWCRRYELYVTAPGDAPERSEATRCRQGGLWKRLPAGE